MISRLSIITCATLCSLVSLIPAQGSATGKLPAKVLVGYWHNWGYSPNNLKLTSIAEDYDVVNISFATPTTPHGAKMQFTPTSAVYSSAQAFKNDVKTLQARGVKVLISIGGANDPVVLKNAADAQTFASSMKQVIVNYGFDGLDIDLEGQSLMLAPGDTKFQAPTTPRIVYLIKAMKQLMASLPADSILSAAPETAFVQGGASAYVGVWGAYLPVLYALQSRFTYVHVQHYNSGGMMARDGKVYTAGTSDFHVAMADMLLNGFKVAGHSQPFPAFAPEQVAFGVPASTRAAGTGYTPAPAIQAALDYLVLGKSFGGQYKLAKPKGYPAFRGLMTWSVNWDAHTGNAFSASHGPHLHNLFLAASRTTITAAAGGTVDFKLRSGAANGGRSHFLLGSLSGQSPGMLLPGGLATLPINLDAFSLVFIDPGTAHIFPGFFGTLDAATGESSAKMILPPVASARGLELTFAFALNQPWDFASNPVTIQLQ